MTLTLRKQLNRLTPYVFLAPAVLVILLALVYPVVQSVWLSFTDWQLGRPLASAQWIGFEHYSYLVRDSSFWASLRVTLAFAFCVVVLEVAIGVALALVLDRQIRGMAALRTIFILPMMVAPIVVGLIWRFLYSEQFGPINSMLQSVGLPGVPWLSSPNIALFSVVLADVWQWTPFIFILALAALQSLPSSALEAARVDGASNWQAIWHVKLPLMTPVITVAALLRLIDAFKVLEVIYILTEGGPGLSTEILSLHIYKTAFVSQELGRASALSNLLLLIVLSLAVGLFVLTKLKEQQAARAQAAAEEA